MSLYDLSPSAGVGAIQQTSPRLPFYGLIQHSGLPLVENPYILGGVVSVNWSEIEPASGVFNWEPLEQKIHPWVRSGKRVAIRIIVSSTPDLTFATPQIPGMKDIWGIQDEFNESIPSWLIGMGVKQCSGGPGMVHPHQYWNPIYLSALQRMIRELGTRYDGKPEVICVYAAVGCDGRTSLEDPPPRQFGITGPSRGLLWRSLGYSESTWLETICTILSCYRAAFEVTPTVAQIVHPFIRQPEETVGRGHLYVREDGNLEDPVSELLAYAISQRMWVEYDCKSTDIAPSEAEWHSGLMVVNPRKSAEMQGRPVMADLHRIISMGASLALIHATDLRNPRNYPALEWASLGAND